MEVYLAFARRWWWLFILGIIVAGFAAHSALSNQPALFRSQATIQIGRTTQDKFPDQGQLAIVDRLVTTYAELVKRDPILIAATEELGLPMSPADVRGRMVVLRTLGVPLIDIVIVDTDPTRAAALANEIARQMVLQSPAASDQDQQTQVFIQKQLTNLQDKITKAQTELATLQNDIAAMTSATDIENANRRAAALQDQIDTWQASYARLVVSAEPSPTNLVALASPAMPSSTPLAKNDTLNYLLALVVGAGLALGIALVLETLTRGITSTHDVKQIVTDLPITTIPRFRNPRRNASGSAFALDPEAASSYRSLRNALFIEDIPSGVTIAVTSTRIGEGKTTTSANLALTLADAGRSVILVDANVRNPELAQRFGVSPIPGFSDLVLGISTLDEAIQTTDHDHLRILTAGAIPAGYESLLSLSSVGNAIASLANIAEVVVFDSAAVNEENDVLLLAKYIDRVILVAEAGHTQQQQVQETLTLLQRAGTPVIAIVLNKMRPPRFSAAYLPWSYDARNRARAQRRRQAHGWAISGQDALRAPGD